MAERETGARSRATRFAHLVLWFAAACVASWLLTVIILHSGASILLLGGGCKEQIISEVPSPNKKLKAVLYVRDCGATTRASTRISVLGNTASGTGPASKDVLAGYEYPWDAKTHKISTQWTSDNYLKVWYTEDVELTHLNNRVGSVHVHFELRPSTPKQ